MTEITRAWMEGLNKQAFEKALALGLYHYRTQLVFIETDKMFQACTDKTRCHKERAKIFDEFFIHWYFLFSSLVYVVHEGFEELGICDVKLNSLSIKADMAKLKRFRNATFHYQPFVRSPKHDNYLNDIGFVASKRFFDRQGILIRRIARLIKYSSYTNNIF